MQSSVHVCLMINVVNGIIWQKGGGVFVNWGWGGVEGRHEAQAPSNQVKNYKQT